MGLREKELKQVDKSQRKFAFGRVIRSWSPRLHLISEMRNVIKWAIGIGCACAVGLAIGLGVGLSGGSEEAGKFIIKSSA